MAIPYISLSMSDLKLKIPELNTDSDEYESNFYLHYLLIKIDR